MNYKCKYNGTSFGYVKDLEVPIKLKKDKEYILKKFDEGIVYYEVLLDNKVITTISEAEFNTLFAN